MSTRRKRCQGCNELKPDVHRYCEQCESRLDYCCLCDDWLDMEGGGCRHLFWSDGGLMGSGADESYANQLHEIRPSLFAFLKHTGWACMLRDALIDGRFHTRTFGSMLGGAQAFELTIPGRRWRSEHFDGSEGDVALGGSWLLSLWTGYWKEIHHEKKFLGRIWSPLGLAVTTEANRETLRIVDQYLNQRPKYFLPLR